MKRLRRAHVRRRWHRAVRVAGVPRFEHQTPAVVRIEEQPAGDRLTLRLPRGATFGDLAAVSEVMAAHLGARDVQVTRDPANAARGHATIVRRDPLEDLRTIPWPNRQAARLDLWDPIPVGIAHDGTQVTLDLAERNLLVGGEPGAGKSVALSLPVATAALDPTTKLWILDGKLVELAAWTPIAEASVGVSVPDAIDVLRTLQAEMDTRYTQLLDAGKRKVGRHDGLPLHVVACDELAHYLTADDRKERNEFTAVLRDLVSRGRAAGIIVLAATQKPSADTVSTSVRDLFGYRWALRCTTPQASDTILGQGWATNGYNAATIDPATRGVGYLLHEGGIPQRLLAYHLDDTDLEHLAQRARHLRAPEIARHVP